MTKPIALLAIGVYVPGTAVPGNKNMPDCAATTAEALIAPQVFCFMLLLEPRTLHQYVV